MQMKAFDVKIERARAEEKTVQERAALERERERMAEMAKLIGKDGSFEEYEGLDGISTGQLRIPLLGIRFPVCQNRFPVGRNSLLSVNQHATIEDVQNETNGIIPSNRAQDMRQHA
jgi:hypothetical protein